ncbi:heterokaryon incompatibility Het-C [Cryomyces antarcticus]
MAFLKLSIFLFLAVLVLLPSPAAAFGAGNIASISKIEGHNWRHGDIEDMLKTVACLKGHKWTSMMVKRVYFGNWLRDYSQAVDVGTLKGVQAGTIRILVWVLAFMGFGYATGEFEVTDERLGVYRPEEHIDNPRDYADNVDARQYDPRLRPPVMPEELAVDPNTGMKNYIANESGGWATSSGYIKYSFARSIHFGRLYTSGAQRGREEDLCEALRCLGQGLHCLEDFGAHTNYTELSLRELGFTNVFPHTGTATQINLRGKRVFPLVTGTFGGVDFLHSMLGEATDHFTQSEVEEMNTALSDASGHGKKSAGGSQNDVAGLTDLLSKIPGTGSLCQEAASLRAAADAQAASNSGQAGAPGYGSGYYGDSSRAAQPPTFAAPPGSVGGPPGPGIPGMNPNLDPQVVITKIYPILQFRDKVVRTISSIVSKIPGLESLIDKITERVTLFVLSLLAPYIQPLITAASAQLKQGSSAVINSSANHQYEPWTDPHCTDPTHSLLSKDHFSNILNEPAGQVAAAILQYVAPRVLYAWDHPGVPEHEVLADVERVFHHPAIRDPRCELHTTMFATVERWARARPDHGASLNQILSSESVRAGHNDSARTAHAHQAAPSMQGPMRDAPDAFASHSQSQSPYPPASAYARPVAGFAPDDPYAFQTSYQQGYETPYQDQSHGQTKDQNQGYAGPYRSQDRPPPNVSPYARQGYQGQGQDYETSQGGYGQGMGMGGWGDQEHQHQQDQAQGQQPYGGGYYHAQQPPY